MRELRIDPHDLQIRGVTYGAFVDLGRAPTVDEVSAATRHAPADIRASWRRLHDAHALVLDDVGELRMLNPFSAVPTPYLVRTDGRSWYANCAWDAFGICAALRADGLIETACADCGEELTIEVRDRRPDRGDLLFHCLLPAAMWWDDIVFT